MEAVAEADVGRDKEAGMGNGGAQGVDGVVGGHQSSCLPFYPDLGIHQLT